MTLSSAEKLRLLHVTKEAASALLEDMDYIRDVVGREGTSRGEIRRLSAVLRRLIADRDLAKVAVPRIGKILIHSVDNTYHYEAAVHAGHLRLFFTGDVRIYGQYLGSFDLHSVPHPQGTGLPTMGKLTSMLYPKGGEPMRDILMRLDGFAQQKVICFMGQWLSRQAVIKYMANLGSGVHSDTPAAPEELLLSRIRNAIQVSKGQDGPHIHIVWETESPADFSSL